MRIKSTLLTGMLILGMMHPALSQQRVSGRVTDVSGGQPLAHALIKIMDSEVGSTSDSLGKFSVIVKELPVTLHISHIGYESVYWPLSHISASPLEIRLRDNASELEEVVVSTGYQQIPRERMTGSFSQVDSKLFNRRVSPDILARLEDVVPGLVFNRRHGANNISIRGRNTLNGDGQPLIVLDNFPFEGDLSSINPNDVENVTVLRDAAASSIWGARAGNGVIVITTRKGGYQRAPVLTFNANVTASEKPDLYYQPQMSTAAYIDWEQYMFQRGFYNSFLNNVNKVAFTPVVELLFQQRAGEVSEAEAMRQIEELKGRDVRRELEKHLYQNGLNRQYSLALSGGSANQKYAISAGYDGMLAATVGDKRERVTLNANHTYGLFNNKLELSTGVYYASQSQERNSPGQLTYTSVRGVQPLYPYARLADEEGRPLLTEKNHRLLYAKQAVDKGLLDWTYSPLEEMQRSDNTTQTQEIRLRAGLTYKILPSLHAEVSYLYQNSTASLRNHYGVDTYFARNLINTYTQVGSNNSLTFPIPRGGILDRNVSTVAGHSLRGQLNVHKSIGIGELDGIMGAELRDHHTERVNSRWYGYADEYATAVQVDYSRYFTSYVNPGSSLIIPSNATQAYLIDRYLSYYANAGYNIKKKYVLSASARLDQSNLFGVKTNQKGVPLWSAGLAWVVSSEEFMKKSLFSYLRLRTTYGSSGNVNKSLSSKTTASFSPTDFVSLLPYATIQNPPNPTLRWEKVKMLNFGLDFETRSGRWGGSLEYYRKRGLDLFGQVPYAPSTGISTFSGNVAETRGQGLDFSVNIKAVRGKNVQWDIFTLLSYVSDKVTDFKVEYPARSFAQTNETGGMALVGRPQYALYSYAFAGLDPENGDPLGYLNGEVSKEWGRIFQTTGVEDLRYHGPARPTLYGSIRNNLSWKGITLSANISYRLGYYFRRSSVSYTNLWQGSPVHGDYENRWRQPGDEQFTSVPSDPGGLNADRSAFYLFSSDLIGRADHFRLQDVQLSYTFDRLGSLKLRNIQVYMYANNLGILWKATKSDLDPDYPVANFPLQRSLATGLRFNF